MPATFRCLSSGQTVTFALQHDIDSMKGHSGYVRVDEEGNEETLHSEDSRTDTAFRAPLPQQRRPGRPRKQENV